MVKSWIKREQDGWNCDWMKKGTRAYAFKLLKPDHKKGKSIKLVCYGCKEMFFDTIPTKGECKKCGHPYLIQVDPSLKGFGLYSWTQRNVTNRIS